MFLIYVFFFFFSSRRRHTRFDCDWSSDVCSSDLEVFLVGVLVGKRLSLPVGLDRPRVLAARQGFQPAGEASHRAMQPLVLRRARSEEHTSELQSQSNLVCRLLLEKKKTNQTPDLTHSSHPSHPPRVSTDHLSHQCHYTLPCTS